MSNNQTWKMVRYKTNWQDSLDEDGRVIGSTCDELTRLMSPQEYAEVDEDEYRDLSVLIHEVPFEIVRAVNSHEPLKLALKVFLAWQEGKHDHEKDIISIEDVENVARVALARAEAH